MNFSIGVRVKKPDLGYFAGEADKQTIATNQRRFGKCSATRVSTNLMNNRRARHETLSRYPASGKLNSIETFSICVPLIKLCWAVLPYKPRPALILGNLAEIEDVPITGPLRPGSAQSQFNLHRLYRSIIACSGAAPHLLAFEHRIMPEEAPRCIQLKKKGMTSLTI